MTEGCCALGRKRNLPVPIHTRPPELPAYLGKLNDVIFFLRLVELCKFSDTKLWVRGVGGSVPRE